MKTNVLLVEGRKDIGGGQIMSYRISRILAKHYSLFVLIPEGESPIDDLFHDFQRYYYPMREYRKGKKYLKDMYSLVVNFFVQYRVVKDILLKNRISLIYVQAPSLVPLMSFVAKRLGIKMIVHLHVVHLDRKTRFLLNFCLRIGNVRKIVGVSHFTLQQLSHCNKEKSTVLYNYINYKDTELRGLHQRKELVVAVIGDVMEIKGHHVLLEALEEMNLQVKVLLIGHIVEEAYRDRLLKMSRHCSLTLVGYVKDVDAYLNQVDLTVIPSIASETFSLAMVESWGKGIPTIASRLGGMEELVTTFLPQYSDTMLFTPLDSRELSTKISNILTNDSLYCGISRAVNNVVSAHFTSAVFEKGILNIVQDVLK